MRHAMLIVLAGCNQIFGLSKTHPIDALPVIDVPDAQYFDTPADAPFDCPPLGGAPAFKTTLHQYAQGCSNYTESEDEHWATAVCASVIEVAKDRAAFAPLTAVTAPMAADPRLAPEGDELFVVSHPTVTISTIEAYKRDHTTDVWMHDFTVQSGLSLSANVTSARRRRAGLAA